MPASVALFKTEQPALIICRKRKRAPVIFVPICLPLPIDRAARHSIAKDEL
jgi:hypothetical protein